MKSSETFRGSHVLPRAGQGAVTVVAPVGKPLPLVCDSPHSGTAYPADFGHALDMQALRQCEDTHVERLWDAAPNVGATLIHANFPRSYIDPNRAESDIDVSMLAGPWPSVVEPSSRCLEHGNGLVFSQTPEHRAIYARRLAVHEVRTRIDSCWRPYRQALAEAIQQQRQAYGRCWHLNLHSMPSNAYQRLGLPADRLLADVVLGDRHGRSCQPLFRDLVASEFRRHGYSVAVNDPYAGQDLLRHFGDPAQGCDSLQIEINRALHLDERTREPSPGFERLRSDIARILEAIAQQLRAWSGAQSSPFRFPCNKDSR